MTLCRPDHYKYPVAGVRGFRAVRQIKNTRDHHQVLEARALRTHVVLRSRFTEDRLAEAVGRGITQYVILGAGFDTFAYRQPVWQKR